MKRLWKDYLNQQRKRLLLVLNRDAAPHNFVESIQPMNAPGIAYVTTNLHEAHHHCLKLLSTNLSLYQTLQSSQLAMYYPEDQVLEAKFIIDLSPIRFVYRDRANHRHWYHYITLLIDIVGGTFTVGA